MPKGSVKPKCRFLKEIPEKNSGCSKTTGEYKKGQEIGDDDMIYKEICMCVRACFGR